MLLCARVTIVCLFLKTHHVHIQMQQYNTSNISMFYVYAIKYLSICSTHAFLRRKTYVDKLPRALKRARLTHLSLFRSRHSQYAFYYMPAHNLLQTHKARLKCHQPRQGASRRSARWASLTRPPRAARGFQVHALTFKGKALPANKHVWRRREVQVRERGNPAQV